MSWAFVIGAGVAGWVGDGLLVGVAVGSSVGVGVGAGVGVGDSATSDGVGEAPVSRGTQTTATSATSSSATAVFTEEVSRHRRLRCPLG